VPRQAQGEWWELADTTRGNRSYFYNTLTKETQWNRPGGDAFVIPLGLIQSATLPKRSNGESDSGSGSGSGPRSLVSTPRIASSGSGTTSGSNEKRGKHPQRQDSIQIHHKGLTKKRSQQQLRSTTSTETIKPSTKQVDREKGRARAATVTAADANGARGVRIDTSSKPLPPPPGQDEDLPPHRGIPGYSNAQAGRGEPSSPSPASPFGNRIFLPPGSPSTPTKSQSLHMRASSTPSTPTPKTSKLAQPVNGIDYTNLSPAQTPLTPDSDRTTTLANRKLRPLSVVGEELSGNEADDSSVSEVERDELGGKGHKAKWYESDTASKRESLFSRRRLSSLGFGILGKAPESECCACVQEELISGSCCDHMLIVQVHRQSRVGVAHCPSRPSLRPALSIRLK
jgi:hypothetical protein